MLRIVFEQDKVEKYRQKGVKIDEHAQAVFPGAFVVFEDNTPCFEIRASTEAEVFGQRKQVEITLEWDPEDIVSLEAFSFPGEFYWKKGWSMAEFQKAHK